MKETESNAEIIRLCAVLLNTEPDLEFPLKYAELLQLGRTGTGGT